MIEIKSEFIQSIQEDENEEIIPLNLFRLGMKKDGEWWYTVVSVEGCFDSYHGTVFTLTNMIKVLSKSCFDEDVTV
jgi:cytochrome oxidase assembly protein ShyY1